MADNRARIWFAAFVLVVFCAGLAGGVFIGRRMGPPRPRGAFGMMGPGDGRAPFGPGPGFGRGRGGGPAQLDLLGRLSSELDLDGSQKDQIQKILDGRRDRLEAIHRDARDKFEKEASDLNAAVRAVLRPDQQQKFDEWVRRRRP